MHVKRRMAQVIAVTAAGAAMVVAAGPAQAITQGEPADPGEYEFAAALSMPRIERSNGSVYASACSGALVAPRWVITAGHCVHDGDRTKIEGEPRYRIDVTVGSTRDQEPVRVVRAVQNRDVDVALVELSEPVESTEPLGIADRAPEAGDELVMAGWGSTSASTDPAARPDRLQTADYDVDRVTPNQMFARATGPGAGTSACPFDSGAPLVATDDDTPTLVATEVNGPVCPHQDVETTARTDVIAGWVRDQISAKG